MLNGGAGNDIMNGGAGSDTYFVDSDKDKVTDLGTADLNDTVVASISIDLSKFAAGLVEHVTLIGDAVLNVNGNAKNNSIIGNGAANLLTGDLGNDTLDGGLVSIPSAAGRATTRTSFMIWPIPSMSKATPT